MSRPVDLEFQYNRTYIPEREAELKIFSGDLSQLGMKRQAFIDDHQLAWFQSTVLSIKDAEVARRIRKALGIKTARVVGLSAVLNMLDDNIPKFSSDNLDAIRTALQPSKTFSLDAVANSEEFKEWLAVQDNKAATGWPIVLADLLGSALNPEFERLKNIMMDYGLMVKGKPTRQTNENDEEIEPEEMKEEAFDDSKTYKPAEKATDFTYFLSIPPQVWHSIESEAPYAEWKKEVQSLWQCLCFTKARQRLLKAMGAEFYQNAYSGPTFERIKRGIEVMQFELSDNLAAKFDENYVYDRLNPNLAVTVSYIGKDPDDNTKEKILDADPKLSPVKMNLLMEFMIFMTNLKHAASSSLERNIEFAATRTLIWRHNLFGKEFCEFTINGDSTITHEPTAAEWDIYRTFVMKPEFYYTGLFASAISFLKSGHHASANNLDNTLSKLMGAIGQPINREAAGNMLKSLVYHGPHPAEMVLLVAYAHLRHKVEHLSGAMLYRIRPTPPLAVAYVTLDIFVTALERSQFFEWTGKLEEYVSFKRAYSIVVSNMHYCAPYSKYLYGKSEPEPVAEKNIMAKFAVYAAGIKQIMPDSTIIQSPALLKMANQAGANDLVATIAVQGFIEAYKRFFKQSIAQKVHKQSLGRGTTVLGITEQ